MNSKQFLPYLEAYIKTQEGIAGSWNGEDDYYQHEGQIYNDEDAQIAHDRMKAAQDLREVILTDDL